MPTFGAYETVNEVSRGALCSVWSARRVVDGGIGGGAGAEGGGGAVFAVKVCQPDAEIAGPEHAARAVGVFRERVDAQRRLGALPESAWAPIHETGEAPGGAYYVTDFCARGSVERMVTSRQRPDARVLHSIVSGALRGIKQVRDFLRRPHGNIQATNVLIEGGGGGPFEVKLTDPAAVSELRGRVDVAGDLRALGEIVYLLVTHQEYHERFGWPIGGSAEWTKLANGERWRALCNRLLDPNPSSAPTVEEIEQTLLNMRAASGKGRGKLIAAGAGGVVLVAGVVGAVLLTRSGPAPAPAPMTAVTPADWVKLVEEYDAWFAEFANDAGKLDAARVEAIGTRAPEFAGWFKAVRGGLTLDDPWDIAGVPRSTRREDLVAQAPSSGPGRDAGKATAELLAVVEGVRSAFASGEWSLAKEAREVATRWRGVGWSGGAERVEQDAAAVKPDADVLRRVTALIATLDRAAEIERARAGVEALAARIDAAAVKIGGDAVLASFKGWAGAYPGEYAATGESSKVLESLAAGVKRVQESGEALEKFLLSPERENVCFDELTKSRVYARLGSGEGVNADLYVDWAHEAKSKEYAKPAKEEDPRLAKNLKQAGEHLARELDALQRNGLAASAETLAALDAASVELGVGAAPGGAGGDAAARVAAVRKRLEEVAALEWDCHNRREIESVGYDAALKRLDQVARAWLALNEREKEDIQAALARLKSLDSPVRDSAAIKGWWESRREEAMAAADDRERLDRSRELEQALLKLNDAAPTWSAPAAASAREGGWVRMVERDAAQQRDAMIEEFLRSRKDPGWTEGEQAALRERVGAWQGELNGVVASHLVAEALLNQGYGLNEVATGETGTVAALLAPGAGGTAVMERVSGSLAPVTLRVKALEGVAGTTDAAALARLVDENPTDRPELTLAAWRRLGELGAGVWPASAGDLEQEAADFRDALRVVVNKQADQERRSSLAREIGAGRRARWEAFVERASSEADVQFALQKERLERLEVDPAAAASPLVRYRAAANAFRGLIVAPGVSDEQVAGAVKAFTSAVPEELKGDAEVSELMGKLGQVVSAEDAGPPKVDPTTLGPGAVGGWTGVEGAGPDGRPTVRFTRGTLQLDFALVEPGPGVPEAMYLGVGEVSLGQFIQLIDLAGTDGWEAVSKFSPDVQNAPPEAPRVWRWTNRGSDGGRMNRASEWLQSQTRGAVGEGAGKMPAYADSLLRPMSGGLGIRESMAPKDVSPIQYVSPETAVYAAALAGCRLPTVDEWKRAVQQTGAGSARPNIRDETWRAQQTYVLDVKQRMNAVADQFPYADAGAFIPPGSPEGDRATVAPDAGNDGWLWFAPAVESGGFSHLRGNVAEMVFAGAGGAPAAADVRGVQSFVSQRERELRVIGGSAIGPPEVRWDEGTPLEDPVGSWSDVGFRLAFTAGGSGARKVSKAELVAAILSGPEADLFLVKK